MNLDLTLLLGLLSFLIYSYSPGFHLNHHNQYHVLLNFKIIFNRICLQQVFQKLKFWVNFTNINLLFLSSIGLLILLNHFIFAWSSSSFHNFLIKIIRTNMFRIAARRVRAVTSRLVLNFLLLWFFWYWPHWLWPPRICFKLDYLFIKCNNSQRNIKFLNTLLKY